MSAPTTTPASAPVETPQQKAARYVPGAGDLASKRPKKKKAGLASADSGKVNTTSASTINGETNVALLSKAPNSNDLPAELRGEQGDIERELKQDAADAAAAGRHEKGAVGEAVSRRMKVLTKKIVSDSDSYPFSNISPPFVLRQQRFRAYMEKPESTLNPDQKAAIATLPALEGGLRELEDIAKAVETIEHEHRATARDEVEAAKLEAVELYKVCMGLAHVWSSADLYADLQRETLPLLSTLISVHSALHPASTSTSTSFMSVDLPAHLQDITSQDVAAVDDMYERLRNGGKEGVEVVLSLVKGLEGERTLSQQRARANDF
jgi:hypothetical protein